MGDIDPGDGAGDCCLEVFGETPTAVKPGESSLDHPSSGQHFKPFGGIRPLDDFQRPLPEIGQSVLQFVSGVAPIREQMAQPRIETSNGGDNADGSVAILNIGGMNRQSDHVACGVRNDVPLAALDLFSRVIATRSATFCRFHRLAIDHASRTVE